MFRKIKRALPKKRLRSNSYESPRVKYLKTRYEIKQRRMDVLYMDIAKRIAQESKATRSKVGAILVKRDNIISFGWNGTPAGMDNCCELPGNVTKPEVIHAESNAFLKLLRRGSESAEGATLYITLSPCFECSKLIFQSGVRRVVYLDEYRIIDGLDFLKERGVQVDRLVYEN